MHWQIEHWPNIDAFADHLAKHQPPAFAKRLILHHTWKPTVADWRGRRTMEGLGRYYRSLGWSAGPHLFVAPDGIWQGTPLNMPGVHANAANSSSIGVEVVGNYDPAPWTEPIRSYAFGTLAMLCRWLDLPVTPDTIQPHRLYNNTKTCPGASIRMDDIRAELFDILLAETDLPDPPIYTTKTPLLGGTPANI